MWRAPRELASANNSLIAGGISAAAAGLLGGGGDYAKAGGFAGGITKSLKTYGTTAAGNPLLFTMP